MLKAIFEALLTLLKFGFAAMTFTCINLGIVAAPIACIYYCKKSSKPEKSVKKAVVYTVAAELIAFIYYLYIYLSYDDQGCLLTVFGPLIIFPIGLIPCAGIAIPFAIHKLKKDYNEKGKKAIIVILSVIEVIIFAWVIFEWISMAKENISPTQYF